MKREGVAGVTARGLALCICVAGAFGVGCGATDYGGDALERRNEPVPTTTVPGTPESPAPRPAGAREDREARSNKLLAFAKTLVGQKTFTSASLVRAVYAKGSIDLPASAALQAAAGTSVEMAQMRKGDLVFAQVGKDAKVVNHVAIYLGDQTVIHANEACDDLIEGPKRGAEDRCTVQIDKFDKKLIEAAVAARDVLR